MAAFSPIPYTYVPTVPRSKSSATCCKPASRQRHKLRCTASDSVQQPAPVAADTEGYRSKIQVEMDGFYSGGEDNDDDLPTIEEILYTTLQEKGFITEDSSVENTVRGVEAALGEKDGHINRSIPASVGDSCGRCGSLDNPIIALEDDSSALPAQANNNSLVTESPASSMEVFDIPGTTVDSTTPAHLYRRDGWHNIDDLPEHEREPLCHTLETRRQQEVEVAEHNNEDNNEDNNKDNNEDDPQPRQEVNNVAAAVTPRVGDTYISCQEDEGPRPAEYKQLRSFCNPSREPCFNKAGSDSDTDSINELDSDSDDEQPYPARKKRLSSSHNCPAPKKRKYGLRQRVFHQRRPRSHLYQDSGVGAVSTPQSQLPSPAPSALQVIDVEALSNRSTVSGSCDILPTLTEVTFRPQSLHSCSFTAVVKDGCDGRGVSFGQLASLIKSIGYAGKINDFTIKATEPNSFLLTGVSRYASNQSSAVTEDLTSEESKRSSGGDDDSSLCDSDTDLSSHDDSSGDKQGHWNTRKHSRWSDLDVQRLLAYKKEDKSWEWIFRKFPGRTQPAIRTRWTMVRARGK